MPQVSIECKRSSVGLIVRDFGSVSELDGELSDSNSTSNLKRGDELIAGSRNSLTEGIE